MGQGHSADLLGFRSRELNLQFGLNSEVTADSPHQQALLFIAFNLIRVHFKSAQIDPGRTSLKQWKQKSSYILNLMHARSVALSPDDSAVMHASSPEKKELHCHTNTASKEDNSGATLLKALLQNKEASHHNDLLL